MGKVSWRGVEMVIATSHRKEDVIAPVFASNLDVQCVVPTDFNSDAFGTFSGEVERKLSPLATARAKCERAIEMTGCTIAIASEGSFGPHPQIGFVPVDEEIIFFLDRKNGIEAHFKEVSLETNYAVEELSTMEALEAFAKRARFPGHGLILSRNNGGSFQSIKGITAWDDLEKAFRELTRSGEAIQAQTDMRAMYNPTRMKVIERAAQGLIKQLLNECERCQFPNFRVTQVKRGLPCSQCSFPTNSIRSYIYLCDSCGFQTEELFPQSKHFEDPMYCEICNP